MSTIYYEPVSDDYRKSFAYLGKKSVPRIDPRSRSLILQSNRKILYRNKEFSVWVSNHLIMYVWKPKKRISCKKNFMLKTQQADISIGVLFLSIPLKTKPISRITQDTDKWFVLKSSCWDLKAHYFLITFDTSVKKKICR